MRNLLAASALLAMTAMVGVQAMHRECGLTASSTTAPNRFNVLSAQGASLPCTQSQFAERMEHKLSQAVKRLLAVRLGDIFVVRSRVADKRVDSGILLFSFASLREPAGWAQLLCGFVVVAFIARRKVNWKAH
jgi:hypothetical protein